MQKQANNSKKSPFKKDVDFQAVDNLLFHTKSTYPNQRKVDSLQQRIQTYEKQPKLLRLSFNEIDFCQICMFLMACEVERLRQIQSENTLEPIKKHVEGLQSSINQWRLRYEQKYRKIYFRELECEEMRNQLQKLRSELKDEQDFERLNNQLESLSLENDRLKEQVHSRNAQEQIRQLQMTIETQRNELESKNRVIRQLKEQQSTHFKSQETQPEFDDLCRELEHLETSYRNLYSEYKTFRSASQIFYDSEVRRESGGNTEQSELIKQLTAENQKLKNELYKQNRRVDTWCC